MQNILVVAEGKNYLLMSIRDHLAKLSYRAIVTPADIDAVNDVKEIVSGILIFADEDLLENNQALYFIKDHAVMEGIPLFAIGHPRDMDDLKDIISANVIALEFLRPISVSVQYLSEQIDHFIRHYSKQKKILVVDDSGAMLRTVKSWLEGKYTVSLVNSGAMAIKYLSLNRPDLVLLDYNMPVVDGKQVLEMIRTETDFADIPVIFLTAIGDKESVMKVQGLRPEGYLLKSMEPEMIVKAVDDFFEKKKALI